MGAMRSIQILAPLLLLAACSPGVEAGPERIVEPRTFEGPAPRGVALLRQAMEAGHRAARGEAGLPPLAWDSALARDAKTYADTLATTGRFEHSAQPRGVPEQGENLWTGTRGAYRYDEMVGHWVAEKRAYATLWLCRGEQCARRSCRVSVRAGGQCRRTAGLLRVGRG